MNRAEQRFLCPHCRQKLGCEEGYSGWQIQCPACGGAVIVPLPLTNPLTVRSLISPPPVPGSSSTSVSPQSRKSLRGQEWLILAATSLVFAAGFMMGMVRWLDGYWPWGVRASAFENGIWFVLGLVGFWIGAAICFAPRQKLTEGIGGGILIPLLTVGSFWAGLNFLAGGCGAACGGTPVAHQRGIDLMWSSALWFAGFAVLWFALSAWLFSRRRS